MRVTSLAFLALSPCLAAQAPLVQSPDVGTKLINIALRHREAGRPSDALAWLALAGDELAALGDQRLLASVWWWTAQCSADVSKTADACAAYEEARRLFLEVGERGDAASCVARVGYLRTRLGEHAAARACAEQALTEWHALGQEDQETVALGNLGLACAMLGEYARAFEVLEQALARNEAAGNQEGLDANVDALATLYARLGQPERALELHRRSLQISETRDDPNSLAASLNNIAVELATLRRFDEALATYRRALAITESTGNRTGTAALVGNMGLCLTNLGRFDEALTYQERALALHRDLGSRSGAATSRNNIGLIHARAGRHREALAVYESSLAAEDESAPRSEVATTWANLADARQRLGQHVEALAAATRHQDLRLAEARGLGEATAGGTRRLATRAAECALVSAHALLADAARPPDAVRATAFHCVEAGRALLLAEQVQNRTALMAVRVPADLIAAEAAARGAVQAARVRVARAAHADARAVARTALDAAYHDLEDTIARLQRAARRTADVVFPEPVGLAELQAALPTDTTFVSYVMGSERAFAFVVGRDAADIVDLGVTADLDRRAQAWLRLLQHPASEEAGQAAALYDQLVRPLEPHLVGRGRLLIAPAGALSFLPFAALLRSDGQGSERLVERLEVAYVPSATVYLSLVREAAAPGERLVALGDPIYPSEHDATDDAATRGARELSLRGLAALPRLPGSGDEVRALAQLFGDAHSTVLTRAHASQADLRRALTGPRLRALHLACHGHVDDQRPRLSGLVLAEGEMLTLDDVAGLDLAADLVVLSACESGRGSVVTGEGILGLVRAFMAAGAPRVVVANWKISDSGTRALILEFYGALLREGLTPAAALRATQLARLRQGGAPAHPSHWAAFVVWGG